MSSVVSINEKKDFLKWFLNAFQLKRRECAWLLNYLVADDSLMEKVHFVEGAEFCPKGLVISTTDVDKIPFCFHKNKHITMDAEKAFHDIRLNNYEEIYMQLNFPNASASPKYAVVLEDNPFKPKSSKTVITDGIIAEIFLDKAIVSFREQQLIRQIDVALDNRDEELFYKLTSQLNSQ